MANNKINYSKISWCLLMFEEQLLLKEIEKLSLNPRLKEFWFGMSEERKSLWMHFNRVPRIESALAYFREMQYPMIYKNRRKIIIQKC